MLVTEYHLTIDQVYELTPRQVVDVYFHPRDKDGSVKAPQRPAGNPADPVQRLEQLLALIANGVGPRDPAVKAELQKRLEEARGNARRSAERPAGGEHPSAEDAGGGG